jgi:general stress protein YciG
MILNKQKDVQIMHSVFYDENWSPEFKMTVNLFFHKEMIEHGQYEPWDAKKLAALINLAMKEGVKMNGAKGGQSCADTHGSEYYQQIGRKGGNRCYDTHGPEFYSEIGHMGGKKTAKLIQLGKEKLQEMENRKNEKA